MEKPLSRPDNFTLASYVLALIALVAILQLHLLPAFLVGLLLYQIVHLGALALGRMGVGASLAKGVLIILIVTIVTSALSLGVALLAHQIRGDPESFVALMRKMADVVDTAVSRLPESMRTYVPANVDEWQVAAAGWLRDNASQLSSIGRNIGMFLVHFVIGMVIGGLVAFHRAMDTRLRGPLAKAMAERVIFLSRAFRRIIFSQIRISALNTFLTAIFLLGVMPLLGSPLPFTKTMIAMTFMVGLLPIIGNIISNTVIVLIALSVSAVAAIGSLIFLILIHKLEYFVNARIIGTQIRAHAWEILLAMLAMEAAFGIAGLVAAPIYYAYLKDELSARGWI